MVWCPLTKPLRGKSAGLMTAQAWPASTNRPIESRNQGQSSGSRIQAPRPTFPFQKQKGNVQNCYILVPSDPQVKPYSRLENISGAGVASPSPQHLHAPKVNPCFQPFYHSLTLQSPRNPRALWDIPCLHPAPGSQHLPWLLLPCSEKTKLPGPAFIRGPAAHTQPGPSLASLLLPTGSGQSSLRGQLHVRPPQVPSCGFTPVASTQSRMPPSVCLCPQPERKLFEGKLSA